MSEQTWRPAHDPYGLHSEHPWDYEGIEIWREEWPEPRATKWEDMNPMMNVIGLQWRPISERRTPGPYRLPLYEVQPFSLQHYLGRLNGRE